MSLDSKPKSMLIVISAPSGTGKTTLCSKLLHDIPDLILSVSTTTRPPRGEEKHGAHYFFISKEEFGRKIQAGGFAEWAEVHGNFYGTSKDFIEAAFAQGKSLLLDIDVQGADSLKIAYPDQTLRIFLEPPTMDELERRLRARGTDSNDSIVKRLSAAATEMAKKGHFDHVVVNDDLEKAYFELTGIVLAAIHGQVLAKGRP